MSDKEYIERGALIAFVKSVRQRLPKDSKDFFTRDEMLLNFQQYVDVQPAADVEPVVHAHWAKKYRGDYDEVGYYICSHCEREPLCNGVEEPELSDFCPNCGAHMDEHATE